MVSLIKSKERVQDVGEVFTPDFLVEQMLNQFPEDAWRKSKSWLEPTCGNGQFVIGVLNRKLLHGHKLLEALDTTFGCDIMPDNVSECHMRIYKDVVLPYVKLRRVKWNDLRWKVVCIVENNIRHTKNSLDEDFSKWKRFSSTSEEYQSAAELKIKSIFGLIDIGEEMETKSPYDKRLLKELSQLKR